MIIRFYYTSHKTFPNVLPTCVILPYPVHCLAYNCILCFLLIYNGIPISSDKYRYIYL